jgi:hypothetical protein
MANPFRGLGSDTLMIEGITGPDGADRMYITVGVASTLPTKEEMDWTGLIDPALLPGQYRRSIVSASLSMIGAEGAVSSGVANVLNAEADWDDESQRVELRLTTVGDVYGVAFHVVTLAAPPA